MEYFLHVFVNRHRSAQCDKERQHSQRYTQKIHHVSGKEF